MSSPTDGATYTVGQNVSVKYGCADGPSGSGITYRELAMPLAVERRLLTAA
jgi:hypothetical protein